jgi:hypothetical protein
VRFWVGHRRAGLVDGVGSDGGGKAGGNEGDGGDGTGLQGLSRPSTLCTRFGT